jgi:molybdate transport system ATP-binding protein
MVGLSLIHGEVHAGTLTTRSGTSVIVPADTPSGPSVASIRPSAVSLHRSRPEGSARNTWSMTVSDIDRHPDRVRARLEGPLPLLAEVTPAGADALELRIGDSVWASVKASEVTVAPDLAR